MADDTKVTNEATEPTDEQINQWKTIAPSNKVYRVTLLSGIYYYRGLLRPEWRQIVKVVSGQAQVSITGVPSADTNFLTEDQVMMTCVLHPRMDANNLQGLPAGTPTTLYNLIMEASSFEEDVLPEEL